MNFLKKEAFMPIGICPNCDKFIDSDGFVEHGLGKTLFYCECGKVFDLGNGFKFIEVPRDEVDLAHVPGWPVPKGYYNTERVSRGIYIYKSRWKRNENL